MPPPPAVRFLPRFLAAVLFSARILSALADPLDEWIRPLPLYYGTSDFAFGNGLYVTVGDAGVILTSSNLVSWTAHKVSASYSLRSIAYGHGTFVAVGAGISLTSVNGGNWFATPLPTGEPGRLVFANDSFWLLAGDGLFTSSDGRTWVQPLKIANRGLGRLAHGHGVTVISHSSGLLYSTPAGGWEELDLGRAVTGVAFGNGVFVALSGGLILTSSDGQSWAIRKSPAPGIVGDLAFGHGLFLGTSPTGRVVTSPDGISWSNPGEVVGPGGFIYLLGTKFLVTSATIGISFSENGNDWTRTGLGDPLILGIKAVAFGGDLFVGGTEKGAMFSSPDGVNWTSTRLGDDGHRLASVAAGKGGFVAVGVKFTPDGGGRPLTLFSPDGLTWHDQVQTNIGWLTGVVFGRDRFIAVGGTPPDTNGVQSPILLASTDGQHWTPQILPDLPSVLLNVGYGNGTFLAAGHRAGIVTSRDGENWTPRRSPLGYGMPGVAFTGVAYGRDVFTVVGLAGTTGFILTTWDEGVTWLSQERLPAINNVIFADGLFLAVGDATLSSTNGFDWHIRNWFSRLTGLTYGKNTILTANGFYLYKSSPLVALSAPSPGPGQPPNRFDLNLTSEAGTEIILESSLDLNSWTPFRVLPGGGSQVITDDRAIGGLQFYRARLRPL